MGNDKRNPALIELIIVILFFSMSTVIIVQIFMASYQISLKSQNESILIIKTQDIIEQLKSDPTSPEKILMDWNVTNNQNNRLFTACFDSQMNRTNKDQSRYIIEIQIEKIKTSSGLLVKFNLSAYENTVDKQILLNLNASQYLPENAS